MQGKLWVVLVSGSAAVQRSCAETGEGMQGASCGDAEQGREKAVLQILEFR